MKRRACIVVANEMFARAFLIRQIAAMQPNYDVTVVVNGPSPALASDLGGAVAVRSLPIARHVAPLMDLRCLAEFVRLMRAERFDLVQSMTPKAGLLAMTAARVARIPVRIHTFTGQVWATRSGAQRIALRFVDKVMASASTFTLADSPSQRDFLVAQGVVPAWKIAVPGRGSVSGVDASRFRPDAVVRRTVRESLGIPLTDTVLLFVGRLQRDKGVLDLARAFSALADERPDLRLLVVGPDEQGLSSMISELCGRHEARLHLCGYTQAPEHFMAASDVLCLPSYREGFGSVIIEAAAAGLPAVASRIYGIVDAVDDGATGLLHEPADVASLTNQLRRLVIDSGLRCSLGAAARARAMRDFSPEALVASLLDVYARHEATSPGRAAARIRGTRPPSVRPAGSGWRLRYGNRTLEAGVARGKPWLTND